jgi:hypothetical protein
LTVWAEKLNHRRAQASRTRLHAGLRLAQAHTSAHRRPGAAQRNISPRLAYQPVDIGGNHTVAYRNPMNFKGRGSVKHHRPFVRCGKLAALRGISRCGHPPASALAEQDRGLRSDAPVAASRTARSRVTIPLAPRSVASTPVGPTTELHDIAEDDEYCCPAGQRAVCRFTSAEEGLPINTYWSSACSIDGQLCGNPRLDITARLQRADHDVWRE